MPREVFVAGQILTAAEMNIVSDQTVMSFAGTAARGSAIPTPSEGMAAYLNDSNILSLYDGAAWKNSLGVTGGILQVVSTTKTDTFTTASTSYTDLTGLSVAITPSSVASKVLVFVSIEGASTNATANSIGSFQVVRDSTAIGIGDAAGSRTRATGGLSTRLTASNAFTVGVAKTLLDSPNSSSSVTYKAQVRVSGGTLFINRQENDSDDTNGYRTVSSITVMEVAG